VIQKQEKTPSVCDDSSSIRNQPDLTTPERGAKVIRGMQAPIKGEGERKWLGGISFHMRRVRIFSEGGRKVLQGAASLGRLEIGDIG